MKTNAKNQLIGTLAALRESYGNDTKLCDLRDAEFTTGGYVSEAVKAAGYDGGGRAVINQNNWWTLTTLEFSEQVLSVVQ